ncbi:diacylglycerol kinase [Pseudocercospora fijiensis CIRAD86]|uniref:Diacylglycerol kinase n=1 Tax=Pseudocercospora fijiensis (strain CIRAD86) TaxID=383855 RepID=N1Q9X5_PSEFD|nr:diacylglycerol kinase [Pseudocercospora fijiensis CIRAD86]EME89720.1 diacylglycerol kinase [Pseudocercospora fijiensis CIRAD86]
MPKTASPAPSGHNPFDDPAGSEASLESNNVLTVDRNATLTLGTDSLILLDDGLRHRRKFCGLLPSLSKTTRAIPFHSILWAGLSDFEVTVHYVQPVGRKSKACKVSYIHYTITDKTLHSHAKQWVEQLLNRAYPPNTRRKKRIKVLVNPFGGQGYAQKIWTRDVEPILAAAQCEIDVERTAYRGHAVEIAEKLDIDAFDVVACASGDGLPHEVFNGLAKRPDARRALRKIALCQIPCGSGNAMSLNCNGTDSASLAAVEIVKGIRTPLDLVAITQGDRRMWSFLSQAVGIIAETDLGTESLRWMGSFRFTWGLLVRMLGKTIYPAEISVVTETDDKRAVRELYRRAAEEHEAANSKNLHTDEEEDEHPDPSDQQLPTLKYGTILDRLHPDFLTTDHPNLGNFYAGNMCYMSPDAPFFAAALPSDGRLDLVNIPGDISRLSALQMLVKVENGTLIDFPQVQYSKILAFRIKPRKAAPEAGRRLRARFRQWLGGTAGQTEGLIAIDGERIPFEPFQAEVVPRLGTVLSKDGKYEFAGPKAP